MQNELKTGPKDRAWINKSKKKPANKDSATVAKGKKERKKRKMEDMDPEDREMNKTADYYARAAKRARKPKKIRSCLEKGPKRKK